MGCGTQNPESHFAGGVAAEYGPVLYEQHANPLSRRRDRAADARETSTDDDEVA